MLKTYPEQIAASLREGLREGRWTGTMPGCDRLAREFNASSRTVVRALALLEQEGLLESQGVGSARKIVQMKSRVTLPQVKMILYERADATNSMILELRRRLENAGHRFSFAPKSLQELKQDPERVGKMVEKNPNGLWIIVAGPKPVLEWFVKANIPAFALFGGIVELLPIAGAGTASLAALREGLHLLFKLGHQKIVMLTRKERRIPKLLKTEQVFLEELKLQGISSGSYNLPDWEESAVGLRQCLDRLFALTPPTAILIGDTQLFLAVSKYLAMKRGKGFRHVALISMDPDPCFDWCDPPVAHFRWDEQAVVRRVVSWVGNMTRGKKDLRQVKKPSKLIGGESLPRVGDI